jgi:hypothetical protein
MFVLIEQEKGISPLQEARIASVFHSINEPKIAAAERPAEPTRAFILTLQSSPDEVEIKVVLYLVRSQTRLVYAPEGGGCRVAERKETEAEALDFVEGMGFMMDNMNLAKLKAADRKAALSELPIFEKPEEVSVSAQILEAEAELEATRNEKEEPEIPMVSRVKPKSAPLAAQMDDALSLEDLDEEFRREEIGIGDVDSALESVFGPIEGKTETAQRPGGGKQDLGVPTRWRTIVRFLASF